MGVKIEVGGRVYNALDYSVTEDATPLSAGDSFGGTGVFSFTIPTPLHDDPVNEFGPAWAIGRDVRLSDSYRGFTLGEVTTYAHSDDGATITFTCSTRLASLNVYNASTQPFIGTLGGAFEYLVGVAGVNTDWFVDESIASRPVLIPGFTGDLWVRLKQLAVAQDCDISLVSGVILLRPIRARVAELGKEITRGRNAGGGNIAQSVEVYWYDSESITDELVYPSGGWTPEVEVLNVNAGETAEYPVDLNASLSSIQTPVMQTFVAQDYDASSVYTIVADDGLPVDPVMWADHGGSVTVTLNPDTTSLLISLVGATDIPVATGGVSRSFSLALASDTSGSRYSTLRIVGTGIRYDRILRTFRTGVPASRTETAVGETIDNPMLTNRASAIRAGVRAAKRWTGLVPTINSTITAINRRGDSGVASYPTYGQVEEALTAELGSPSYGDVETYYVTTLGLATYRAIREYWFEFVRNDYSNQIFGNVNGARVWDKVSRRWYRVRTGNLSPGVIELSGEDDLTYDDMETFLTNKTYGEVQASRTGLRYQDDYLLGLYYA